MVAPEIELALSSIRQKNIFLEGEGNAWFERNRTALERVVKDQSDPVCAAIRALPLRPREILEIGCANGWRLDLLTREYAASGTGIDPSEEAIAEGRAHFQTLDLSCGTAEALPFAESRFDLLIYGFCLYLCDRRDLFRIVAEGDRVLADGGYLVIHDFLVKAPHRRTYSHDPRLVSYKMDHAALFCANPNYRIVSTGIMDASGEVPKSEDDAIGIVVLKKDLAAGFPLRAVKS